MGGGRGFWVWWSGVVLAPLHRVGFINFTTVGHIFLKMDTFWVGMGVCYHRLFSSEFLPQGDWGQKDRDRDWGPGVWAVCVVHSSSLIKFLTS